MTLFTVFPAIDLRMGKVVRLAQGDPEQQTVYGQDPARVAARWLAAGADWLHVVDLDGAFGDSGRGNRAALAAILRTNARVQFGGGLRTLGQIEQALSSGVKRLILGTSAAESPELVREAIARFGSDRVGVGIDVREGRVQVRGWTQDSGLDSQELAKQLYEIGARTVVHTDITRDGMGRGLNVDASRELSKAIDLHVIASGGVVSLDDVRRARQAGLRGVIIGRALYEGQISLQEALRC
ncbi:MAG: 1-(5-phosphoribosyl)-5-[(5-phosphoribosylamino)methylideneamino]imidazole-4-carboxamide isomerase [Chloroflexi bacterium]|nr:1-(5-phosphoribosyl)-5-[(5-phosphoribosylamino)methylideneamino]imidazole-4-carboxamide isomerase [Chloroflexota bacterium]